MVPISRSSGVDVITGAGLARALDGIECVIDADGRVADMQVLEGPPLLREAARDAVGQWRYRPTLLNGTPISIVMSVRVEFHLK